MRRTKSVKTLLEVFEHSQNAISTVDLVERFQHQMNKSTVYRILERLENVGTLHSFIGKDGIKWYATYTGSKNKDVHPHFQCQNCGKTECVPIHITIPELTKYNVESASILLLGKCKKCSVSI